MTRPLRTLGGIVATLGLFIGGVFASSAYVQYVTRTNVDAPNLHMPTLGGIRYWQDIEAVDGWKIQKNTLTDHCRVVDPEGWRRAWGGESRCGTKLQELAGHEQTSNRSKPLIVLIHGIASGPDPFAKMERHLNDHGYETVPFRYPSTQLTIEESAGALNDFLNRLTGPTDISIVTHSMGGLVVRQALSTQPRWTARMSLNRIIMIAPPNQGSRIAERFANQAVYKWIYGPAGQQLVPAVAQAFPAVDRPVGIIAGDWRPFRSLHPILSSVNDGTVAVSETDMQGDYDRTIIDAQHSLILRNKNTLAAVLCYIEFGRFDCAQSAKES